MSGKGWNNLAAAPKRMSMTWLAALVLLASCNPAQKSASEKPAQQTFASPEEAGAALFAAARSGDQGALLAIFGPGGEDVLFTGDSVRDQDNLKGFVASYDQMHRWGNLKAGGKVLYTGADNFAFPIPLDNNSSGQWSFDTAAGKDEILARRIGRGELTAIAACGAAAIAEEQYFSKAKQYAQRFASDQGQQNGLYWPVAEGQSASPLGPLGDFAKALGYPNSGDKPQVFNGYYYRILTKQGGATKGGAKDYIVDGKMTGGFAILAYPVEYRNTGIMTFLIGKDGVIYQKDLGEKTTDQGGAMTEYNPGEGWSPAV
jgi:Protein of unknown function (DUF2950)